MIATIFYYSSRKVHTAKCTRAEQSGKQNVYINRKVMKEVAFIEGGKSL